MTRNALMTGVATLAMSVSAMAAEGEDIMSRLAALEGEWMLLDEQGEVTDVVGASFRVTSAGSTLMERMFPDHPDGHEMLNVYHVDGDRLLMTHYCAAGNQPRLRALATDDESRLQWQMESITNLSAPGANHMHQAEYVFQGDDRLTCYVDHETGMGIHEPAPLNHVQRSIFSKQWKV